MNIMSNTATTIDFGKLYAIQPITFAPLKKMNWTVKYGSKIFKLSEFSQEIGLEPYVKLATLISVSDVGAFPVIVREVFFPDPKQPNSKTYLAIQQSNNAFYLAVQQSNSAYYLAIHGLGQIVHEGPSSNT